MIEGTLSDVLNTMVTKKTQGDSSNLLLLYRKFSDFPCSGFYTAVRCSSKNNVHVILRE